MQTLAILLSVLQFLTGTFNSVPAQIFDTFNILNPNYSVESLTKSLNQLIGPVRNFTASDLTLSARAAIVTDFDSGKILMRKNDNLRLPMASITKLMTALVALDVYGTNLDAVVTVPSEALGGASGSRMYLTTGETITVRNLLNGLLIASANDAARTLAYTSSGSLATFVAKMNDKAGVLGLANTKFMNPTGFDDAGHYSTAFDIARLAQTALANPVIAPVVSIKQTVVTDTTGRAKHTLRSTNLLLGRYENVVGVKTGTTEDAGESLVAAATGSADQKVIVVLLDSPDRFGEGGKALDWALKSHTWIEAL